MKPFSIVRDGKSIELTKAELYDAHAAWEELSRYEWVRSLVKEEMEDQGIVKNDRFIDAATKEAIGDFLEAIDDSGEKACDDIFDIVRAAIAKIITVHVGE